VSRAVSKQRVAKSVGGRIFFPSAVTGEQGRTVLDLYRLGVRSVGTAGLKSSLVFIGDDQVTDAEVMDGRESSLRVSRDERYERRGERIGEFVAVVVAEENRKRFVRCAR